jgi:hypothetical protein
MDFMELNTYIISQETLYPSYFNSLPQVVPMDRMGHNCHKLSSTTDVVDTNFELQKERIFNIDTMQSDLWK